MTTEKTLSLVRMSDVQLQEVKWLWKPYIPFGKLTIIQGDPGEGKTTFALRLAAVAERTGCAIIMVGHLNKAQGSSSAYRGLGSIDFRAAARSVLLVGRLKKEPNVRVIVHDKSSLAPEGKSIAFNLGNEDGFYWLDGYSEISAEELLCGFSAETKTAVAEELIRSMLADGKEVTAEEIFRTAANKNISQRTVNEAKKNISGIKTRKIGKGWAWSIPK